MINIGDMYNTSYMKYFPAKKGGRGMQMNNEPR